MEAATAELHRLNLRPLGEHVGAAIETPIEDIVASPALSAAVVLPLEQRQKGPQRPPVCRHPANGKAYLHIPHRLDSVIPGLGEAESRALLEELWAHIEASPYRLTETADSGSCVIMDNCAVVHNRQGWPVTEPRTVWAIACAGPAPVGAA